MLERIHHAKDENIAGRKDACRNSGRRRSPVAKCPRFYPCEIGGRAALWHPPRSVCHVTQPLLGGGPGALTPASGPLRDPVEPAAGVRSTGFFIVRDTTPPGRSAGMLFCVFWSEEASRPGAGLAETIWAGGVTSDRWVAGARAAGFDSPPDRFIWMNHFRSSKEAYHVTQESPFQPAGHEQAPEGILIRRPRSNGVTAMSMATRNC